MAIDLPPVIPPQLSSVERIEAYAPSSASAIDIDIAGRRLLITGNRYLSEAQLRELLGGAQTPSQAIRALNQAYYQAGHLLVTLYYAPSAGDVRVHVVNAGVAGIEAPDKIRVHFEPLVGDEDLHRSEFETRRVLADLKSERAGEDYRISYVVKDGDPEAYVLLFAPSEQEEADALDVFAQLGNQGNRFLGRYFAGAGVRQRLDWGTEWTISYETAITEWGESRGGNAYDGVQFALNHPSRWGLYGVDSTYIRYELETTTVQQADGLPLVELGGTLICGLLPGLCPDGVPFGSGEVTVSNEQLEAEVATVALTGEQLLFDDGRQRWTVSQRLEHIDTGIEFVSGGAFLDEVYNTFELGSRYFRDLNLFDRPARVDLQLFVETGLSDDAGTLGTETEEGVVSQGRRTADYTMLRPSARLAAQLSSNVSAHLDWSAQFSDGSQLPQQQQWVLGGMSSMSAYLPAVLLGDSGTFTRATLEGSGWDYRGVQLVPSLFLEYGQAWYEDANGSQGATRSLSDAGFGLRAQWRDSFQMELLAAVPVSDDNFQASDLESREADFFWRLKAEF